MDLETEAPEAFDQFVFGAFWMNAIKVVGTLFAVVGAIADLGVEEAKDLMGNFDSSEVTM